jgi:hypothetical protein
MPKNIMDKFSEAVSRRSFIGTLSAAAAALVLSIFDKVQASGPTCPEHTFKVGCCCLCLDPRTCLYGSCACQWSWTCPDVSICRNYTCRECYSAIGPWCPPPLGSNGDGCGSAIKCSKANYTRMDICP